MSKVAACPGAFPLWAANSFFPPLCHGHPRQIAPQGPLWLLRGPPNRRRIPAFSAALAPQTHWHSQPGGARAHYADALRGAARCNYKPAASVRLALAVDGNRHLSSFLSTPRFGITVRCYFCPFLPFTLFSVHLRLFLIYSVLCISAIIPNTINQSPRFNLLFSPFPLVNHAHQLQPCRLVVWLRHLVGGPHLGWLILSPLRATASQFSAQPAIFRNPQIGLASLDLLQPRLMSSSTPKFPVRFCHWALCGSLFLHLLSRAAYHAAYMY